MQITIELDDATVRALEAVGHPPSPDSPDAHLAAAAVEVIVNWAAQHATPATALTPEKSPMRNPIASSTPWQGWNAPSS